MSISSRVWEWWHSWVPPSALVVVDPLPELDATEHIARRCHAILVGRTPSPKGQLVLTTHRLIYRPLVHQAERAFFGSRIARSMMPMVQIDLCEILYVEVSGWFTHLWGGYPGFPRITVGLRNGTTHSFQVDRCEEWQAHIKQLRRRQCDR